MNYVKEVENIGYSILRAGEIDERDFIQFASQFGNIQSHLRADASGVTSLKSDSTQDFVSEEYDMPDMMPHTDGPYLSVPYQVSPSTVIRLDPPMLVLFYCQQSALSNGETVLIDMQGVLKKFFTEYPGSEKILKSPSCVTFIKGSLFSGELPFLEELSEGRYRIRFRVDPQSLVADWAYETVKNLINFVRSNKEYHNSVSLRKGEILIFDNYRMLHGRNSFTQSSKISRVLKRIWVANNSPKQLFRLDEAGSITNSERSKSYRPFITQADGTSRRTILDLGIKSI